LERDYPEPGNFGVTPAWGIYARHARNLDVHHVVLGVAAADLRPPVSLEDVDGAEFEHVAAPLQPGVAGVSLAGVTAFTAESCAGTPDTGRRGAP
jgi:hypothetical protein